MNELTINLRANDKTPLYEQIYHYIRDNIIDGKLSYHEKLPSTRALSKYLEVSRSTVELAYEQLLSEGYIESEPYRGYFVAEIEEMCQVTPKNVVHKPIIREEGPAYLYDFSTTGVDLNSFPYNTWRKLSKEVLVDDKTELFRLGEAQGELAFRESICRYLYQARGVNCSPEQIVVGAGSDYLLMLLCSIISKTSVIAVENPAYKQAYRMFTSQGYQVCPIEMDRYGVRVEDLERCNADVVYVTPSHQFPTGIVMPMKRRVELLKWAEQKEERYIIEDDYDSEFRYKGKPIPALQGNDRSERVIYLGTFSKSIAPAIRMSYMVLPRKLLELFRERCSFMSSTVSKVDQLIVQRFLEEGYFERHLNKSRALYKARHDALITGLKPLAEICKISGEHAGVHLILRFQNETSVEKLVQKAKENRIRVYSMSEYMIGDVKPEQPTILLGYANMPEDKIREATKLLCEIWK